MLVLLFLVLLADGALQKPLEKSGNASGDSDYYDDYSEEDVRENQGVVVRHNVTDFENYLVRILDRYYEKYVRPRKADDAKAETLDIYDQMQSDQPVTQNLNVNGEHNSSDYSAMRRGKDKEDWLEVIKKKILEQVGRDNTTNKTTPKIERENIPVFNFSEIIPKFLNNNTLPDDQIAEEIRSYYPSCELPRNIDSDLLMDRNALNLYFNFDHAPDDSRGVNVATATLRLYRLPFVNSSKALNEEKPRCESSIPADDEKLLRVSIYRYTRRKHKDRNLVKRLICDSKVIGEHAKWVELSVKPAMRAWFRGRNLGLAVVVEDQEGNFLRADDYFKGASCTVGASTPKPIPTIIVDAVRNELERANGVPGRNSTAALRSDVSLLPTIDICTLEFPVNFTHPSQLSALRVSACNLRKLHEDSQMLAERERREHLASISGLLEPTMGRHIRHHRQHAAEKPSNFDPRSRMVGQQVLFTNAELQNFNITAIKR